jgi:hypothetical protein
VAVLESEYNMEGGRHACVDRKHDQEVREAQGEQLDQPGAHQQKENKRRGVDRQNGLQKKHRSCIETFF